jgi:hypothetical protein
MVHDDIKQNTNAAFVRSGIGDYNRKYWANIGVTGNPVKRKTGTALITTSISAMAPRGKNGGVKNGCAVVLVIMMPLVMTT